MCKCKECNNDIVDIKRGKKRMFCDPKCKKDFYKKHPIRTEIDDDEINQIQRLYDSGMSLNDISKQTKYSKTMLWSMSAAKLITIRSRSDAARLTSTGKKLSEEAKLKISIARKKFLMENPDKVPYKLNHKYLKQSYPEKYFTECFGEKFKKQFQFGPYTLDFADTDNRLDIEVDGCQHHLDPRIVEHDVKRNMFLTANGWNVLRIRWSIFKKSSKDEQKEIVDALIMNKIPVHPAITFYSHGASMSDDQFQSILTVKEIKICDRCKGTNDSNYSKFCKMCISKNRIKINWPSVEEMTKLVWEKPTAQIARDMGISDNAITRFCRNNKIKKPGHGYWQRINK